MARRLYLGRLPTDARSDDVTKFFDGYGRIVDCRVMTGFGFVEFESPKDAEEVVHHFNGKSFMGNNIIVEFAKETRRRDYYDGRNSYGSAPPPRRSKPPGYRVEVNGISRDTSWQDLKDFGREAGNVSFADVDRDSSGRGVLEYHTLDDAEHAVKTLDNKELRGVPVRVTLSETRGEFRERRSPPRYRSRSPRRDDRERDRRRSRSPRRRDYDDRRDDYRDRRGGGGGGGDREDREYRREDRRDDRREDREWRY